MIKSFCLKFWNSHEAVFPCIRDLDYNENIYFWIGSTYYRRCKTVPATIMEKSTNLGEVCGKCHMMSPFPHTKLELEMPRVTIWLWLSCGNFHCVPAHKCSLV